MLVFFLDASASSDSELWFPRFMFFRRICCSGAGRPRFDGSLSYCRKLVRVAALTCVKKIRRNNFAQQTIAGEPKETFEPFFSCLVGPLYTLGVVVILLTRHVVVHHALLRDRGRPFELLKSNFCGEYSTITQSRCTEGFGARWTGAGRVGAKKVSTIYHGNLLLCVLVSPNRREVRFV